jgi:macrolide transport system ATP-binding/permease protein
MGEPIAENPCEKMARPEGFEPPTSSFEGLHSIQLSYERAVVISLPNIPEHLNCEGNLMGWSSVCICRGNADMGSLWQDLWFGARMLRKNAGFTAIAILTLALGIGANTAIFSIVDWVLLRPLAISHPERITFLTIQQKERNSNGFSFPDFDDVRKQTTDSFSDVASYDIGQDGLTADGRTQPILVGYVSGNFFRMMGINPVMGRFILPSEGAVAGADPVLVLSYATWQTRFGGDPNVIGKKAAVNGTPVTIVGVGPKGFQGPSAGLDFQAFLPISMETRNLGGERPADFLTNREARSMLIFARLKDGVSLEQAGSELHVISQRLAKEYPKTNADMNLRVWRLGPMGPNSNPASSPVPTLAALFLGLSFLVLVLACLNVANMLLVRAAARGREMAVRAALGAARSRLIRQLLAESLLLAALGCVAGIGVGLMASRAMSSINVTTSFPIVLDFRFDWRVFAFAFGMALVTGILAGIVPALRASRTNLSEMLHEGNRSSTSRRQWVRSALVATQVAGSLALLVVAGLFTRSLGSMHMSDLGFDPQHVMNFTMDPREIGYSNEQSKEFYSQLLARMSSVPGVQSAALAATVPMGEVQLGGEIFVEGRPPVSGQPRDSAGDNYVSPQYFDVMRIPLLRGRAFNDGDKQNSQHVAIINEKMREQYWPKDDPIGRRFTMTDSGKLSDAPDAFFYVPISQHESSLATLQVRAASGAESIAQETVKTVQSIAPTMPVYAVQTMSNAMKGIGGLFLFKAGAVLAASLGILGLILATVGVYGVVSYTASQRTREIGIRMALGAQPGEVLRMVCKQGMIIICAGLAIGLIAALAIGRVVGSFLMGISGTDPVTYVSVTAVLMLIGVTACYVPARRAAGLDPTEALRHE